MKVVSIILLVLGLLSGAHNAFFKSGITVDFGPALVLLFAAIAVRLIWPEEG